MDSEKYYNAIKIKMQEKNYSGSNYIRKVGRELTIFHTDSKKKDYIESKATRIFNDYEYKEKIKWHNSQDGLVKISKKGVLSFPKRDINDQQKFLTHIPYGLTHFLHHISNQQKLIDLPFEYWIDYITRIFFKIPYFTQPMLTKLSDTQFSSDVYDYLERNNIKKESLLFENNEHGDYFYYKGNGYSLFYMKFNQRHLLFKIKTNKK